MGRWGDGGMTRDLYDLLKAIVAGHTPTLAEQYCLQASLLEDSQRADAFGVTVENVASIAAVQQRLLPLVLPEVAALGAVTLPVSMSSSILLDRLWTLWLPLAMQLATWRQALTRPLVAGVLGGQGTGKTTLGAVLTIVLRHLGYRTLSLSLDDLYKTYAERSALRVSDPRLVWRGPPGTHDLALGIEVLDQLQRSISPIAIPRFDKSAFGGMGDRTVSEWVSQIDIVLFEGWFVGVRPIAPAAFDAAPAPIVTAADRAFARDTNARLSDYLPLWECLDKLLILHPIDYRLGMQWRVEAEQQRTRAGKPGMTDVEVQQFVEYFWKALHPELFIRPLLQDGDRVDLVIEIQPDHRPSQIYRPQTCGQNKAHPLNI